MFDEINQEKKQDNYKMQKKENRSKTIILVLINFNLHLKMQTWNRGKKITKCKRRKTEHKNQNGT